MNISTSVIMLTSLALVIVFAGESLAAPPKKPKVMVYSRLWTNSPFTIKPEVKRQVAASPLERDWMLGGIRPDGEGYAVTLINKKDRKNRVRFLPGFSTQEFQLLEVKQDPENRKNSRVKIKKGAQEAWISYDQKLVQVVAAKPSTKSSAKTSEKPPTPSKTSNSKARSRYVPSRR